jgi:hypothetical protein
MIIGYARGSTTEQNLELKHDNLKPAFDASVNPTTRATIRSVWPASSARQLVDRPDGDTVRRPVPRRPWERRYPCCFLDSATDFLSNCSRTLTSISLILLI